MRLVLASSAFLAFLLGSLTARAQAPTCTPQAQVTSCDGNSGYYVAPDDRDKVQPQLDPLLKELRVCLDANGAKHVTPAIVIRFDTDGKPVESRVEAGAYQNLPCVADVTAKLANARSVRSTSMRCEYGCPRPKTAPPVTPPPATTPPPPVVFGPPGTQPQQPPPQQQQPAQQQQPVPPPPPTSYKPTTRTEKVWYGWQNLVVDAGASTFFIAGVLTKVQGLTLGGGIAFVFGSPTVHWIHGNVGVGFGSMGMRLLLPLAGAGIGALVGVIAAANSTNATDASNDVGEAAGTGALVGMFCGMAIPVLVDALGTGYEKVEVPNTPDGAKTANAATLNVKPIFSIDRNGGGGIAGIGGTF